MTDWHTSHFPSQPPFVGTADACHWHLIGHVFPIPFITGPGCWESRAHLTRFQSGAGDGVYKTKGHSVRQKGLGLRIECLFQPGPSCGKGRTFA